MDKAMDARAWHDKNGVVCGTCKHWRDDVDEKWTNGHFRYCAFQHCGEVAFGRFHFDFCSRWEAADDAERSL